MTFPIWMLLGFAVWTVLILLFTVGIYRWSRILRGKTEIKSFRADVIEGEDWYLRSMRAHANCVENLPVFGAIVFALYASGISGTATNVLVALVLVARVCQSITHVALTQTNAVAFVRFIFFFIQLMSFLGLSGIILWESL
ncbi:MAPEG family protein [Halospina denitrificans]|uniref:MAPEG family protein n=1 Tax=Halospina denitrificans TaxID=332522 RepID=A0A4R7JYD3_9GAMM|nr:MAPEG family protein [Halospina denitrificans]TDT43531.1 MAPEG family protein [Halospina denitrificans]